MLKDPARPAVYEYLSEIALQQGNAERAVSRLEPLIERKLLSENGAYQLWRAHTLLGHRAEALQWYDETTRIRRESQRLGALKREAEQSPESPLAMLVAVYDAATAGDLPAAGRILATLLRTFPEVYQIGLVTQLVTAVQQRSPLPSISSLSGSDLQQLRGERP